MALQVNISKIFCIYALLFATHGRLTFSKQANQQRFNTGFETFGINLLSELVKDNSQRNIIFSPFSIKTCITMAGMGANERTAHEIDNALKQTNRNREELSSQYNSILANYKNSPILQIANKIYVMTGCKIKKKFSVFLKKDFLSSAEPINFEENVAAAQTINSWVESKTNNLIKDLIPPSALSRDTSVVLVNAIHFKGEWVIPFDERFTRKQAFYVDDSNYINVQMMYNEHTFQYGEFPDLDATALKMSYNNSDLSMLIILPNYRNGLLELVNKLKKYKLSDIIQQMYPTRVSVHLPKFKAQFSTELSEPLKQLGLKRMFRDKNAFSNMLEACNRVQVSSVFHKTFIEVNERGTEAAAATGMLVGATSAVLNVKEFKADHGFYYVIHSNIVLFEGIQVFNE